MLFLCTFSLEINPINMSTSLAMAMYKPKEGKAAELQQILDEHIPRLRELDLITTLEAITAISADGTLIEIFEWKSDEAKTVAHQHPAIMAIWGRMMPICEFPALKDLPEAQRPFPNFKVG